MTDETITGSVRAHLISDVPFGVFFIGRHWFHAGGFENVENTEQAGEAFTIGFKEQEYNELKFAETAAKN